MAALTIPDTGNEASVTGLGIVTNVVSIDAITIGQSPIEISTLATTGYKKWRPGDLREKVTVKWKYMWMGADPGFGTSMIPSAEPYAGTAFTITFPANVASSAIIRSN